MLILNAFVLRLLIYKMTKKIRNISISIHYNFTKLNTKKGLETIEQKCVLNKIRTHVEHKDLYISYILYIIISYNSAE